MKKLVSCLVVLLTAFSCGAQVPQLINYQGRLLDGTNLVSGSVGLSLRLYNAPSGGSILYEDSNSVTVADGLYSTLIGDQTNSGDFASALTNAQLWIEVAVNGTALSPRERLASAAYAVRSERADFFAGPISDSQLSTNIPLRNAVNTFSSTNIFNNRVGIRSAKPDRPLAVAGTGGNCEWISLQDTNGATQWHLNSTLGGVDFVQSGVQDGVLFLSTNNNVGIGKLNPATALDVSGTVTASNFTGNGSGLTSLSAGQLAGTISSNNIAAGTISGAMLANGAVGSAQLAAGAVRSSNIANGAVDSAQLAAGAIHGSNIANGAITAAQLAKPPQSGSVASSALNLDFDQVDARVTFPSAFDTTPIVTLGLEATDLALPGACTFFLRSKTAVDFVFHWAAVPPPAPVAVDTNGNVGTDTSLAVVNGNPAISYCDDSNDDLKYVRATDANGASWGTPVTVYTNTAIDSFTSLAVVNGHPAIGFFDAPFDNLKYVRATDANGTNWGPPVAVNPIGVFGANPSLAMVNGNPAFSYYDDANGDLKYARATDANGTSWGAPVTPDSAETVGSYSSLKMVNGNPAISYFCSTLNHLKYVRATDTNGTNWGTPVTVDIGNVGAFSSLAVVNGNPAISYYDFGNGHLRYVRATDAGGTNWGTPVAVDTNSNVGSFTTLVVVNGRPAISYRNISDGDLKYARAADINGASWATPITLHTNGDVSLYASLAVVNGNPAVSYYDDSNGDLTFIRQRATNYPFTVNWIALEP